MEQPIINPPNPYVGSLRVFPGTMVRISGQPRPNATRFAINFQTGPSLNPRDDLALHLSPCFTPPRVVRNSLRQGAWGLEEAWGNGTIVTPHAPFEIIILAEPEQFKIAINGGHYCEFRHRIPYQEITHLTIDGDVNIERITITSSPQQPAYQPTAPAPSYPAPNPMPMPMPSVYPTLVPGGPQPTGPYPTPSVYPSSNVPSGPTPYMPSGTSSHQPGPSPYPSGPSPYPSSMPAAGPVPYPSSGPYPTPSMGSGPPVGYPQQPYQQQPHQQQPGHSSSPFGNLPIGGKALGTLAGVLKEGVYRKFPLARHFL